MSSVVDTSKADPGLALESCETREFFFDTILVKVNVESDVWSPTRHAETLAYAMIRNPHLFCGKTVIDVGTGTGLLGIVALMLGAASVDVTEVDERFLDVAKTNAELNGVCFRRALTRDWLNFTPSDQYDVLVCNPPFFDVRPPVRRRFIDALIEGSTRFVRAGGHLVLIHSSMADFSQTEEMLVSTGYIFSILETYHGMFREAYLKEPGFMEETMAKNGKYQIIGDRYIETLRAYVATRKHPRASQSSDERT